MCLAQGPQRSDPGWAMEKPVILPLVLFHCFTNENNSDFSFRIVSLLLIPLFLLLFLNTLEFHWYCKKRTLILLS